MSPSRIVPRTNTLIVAHLPASAFTDASFFHALRALFARYGPLYAFAPITVFRRCIVTFWSQHDAERCKHDVDHLVLPTTSTGTRAQIRVFRGANSALRQRPAGPTADDDPDPFYLAPPRLEKNFLVSPPGSPPVGWVQPAEDAPHPTPLASDLIAALEKLRHEGRGGSGVEIVYDAEDGTGITVSIVDCDADDLADDQLDFAKRYTHDEWLYGADCEQHMHYDAHKTIPAVSPPPRTGTPRPPMLS